MFNNAARWVEKRKAIKKLCLSVFGEPSKEAESISKELGKTLNWWGQCTQAGLWDFTSVETRWKVWMRLLLHFVSFNAPIQTKICKFDSYFNQNRQTSNCYMNYIQQKSSRFDICPVDMVSGYGDLSAMFGMLWRFLPMMDPSVDVMLSRDLDSR